MTPSQASGPTRSPWPLRRPPPGTENVGLVNPSANADAIIPLIPQVGSGTRSFFLGLLVPALSAPGTCAQVSEENDPTAIYDVSTGLGLSPKDAIEPMSQGRLDLYQGVNNVGTAGPIGGYFLDPSCAYVSGAAACGTGSVSGGTWATNAVTPAVSTVTTGTPAGLGAYTGTGAGGGLFNPSRTLYIYFRSVDLSSTTPFQPGTTLNWVKTLFYNPSGVGGAPYIQQGAGPRSSKTRESARSPRRSAPTSPPARPASR